MELPKECVVGAKFRPFYGPRNSSNRLWHVRGIVDDFAVCRTWREGRWYYDNKHGSYFLVLGDNIEWRVPK